MAGGINMLTGRQGKRLEELSLIHDHVLGIATKIAEMQDPLPQQLNTSIPDFMTTLTSHTRSLKRETWPFLILGDSLQSKLRLASIICGEDVTATLSSTADVTVYISYGERRHGQVVHTDTSLPPVVIENLQGVQEYVTQVHQTSTDGATNSVHRVQLFLNQPCLKAGIDLLLLPGQLKAESLRSAAGHFLFDFFGVMFALELDGNGHVCTEKLQWFLRELVKYSASVDHPVGTSACTVVCLPPNYSPGDESVPRSIDDDNVLLRIKECWPACDDSQIAIVHSDCADPSDSACMAARLHDALSHSLERATDTKIDCLYNWLAAFVNRVIYHLRAFLSQCEKSHEERLQTYSAIQKRLQHLIREAGEFFDMLSKEMDSKMTEAMVLLRNHLTEDMVLYRLSSWDENELPDDTMWRDIDHIINTKISTRIRAELQSWEESNHYFRDVQPHLVGHFELKFSGIESQMITVEAMIARHDSTICLVDIIEQTKIKEEQSIGFLPTTFNLKWQQKVLLGVAAPFLIPLALTIVVVGLPIIGGMAAKDYIAERIAENKLKEYNDDKREYLRKRTCEEVYRFVKSKGLDSYVKSELQPAYKCINQLRDTVPRQIEADKMQIEDLRKDERNAADVARFYQPLMEIFEHDKAWLSLYKIMNMTRPKMDISHKEIQIPESGQIICDGLRGTIQRAYWLAEGETNRRCISAKLLKEKLQIKNVDQYISEENAQRFQANNNIMKFYGVVQQGDQLYHVLEPLRCNLRQALGSAPEMIPEACDKDKYQYLKSKMADVAKGLVYLHDRGWVHFDLSLDTLAVDLQGRVKLTSISCRQLFRLPRDPPRADIYRYSHLPPEVLQTPPTAYTPVSEMYSLGIVLWEAWTGGRAYWHRIGDTVDALDTIDKFVTHIQVSRPELKEFGVADNTASKGVGVGPGRVKATDNPESHLVREPTIKEKVQWVKLMQGCWSETNRLNSKNFLQLVDESYAANMLSFNDGHFAAD